jgi:hypothetical protein
MASTSLSKPLDNPLRSLLVIFLLWKGLLLAIATCSPGPGYDTSTGLNQPYGNDVSNGLASQLLTTIATKLTRWDAIYFIKVAARGYLFEQEWAFGWGFTSLVAFFANGKGTLSDFVNWLCSRVYRPPGDRRGSLSFPRKPRGDQHLTYQSLAICHCPLWPDTGPLSRTKVQEACFHYSVPPRLVASRPVSVSAVQ